MGTNREIISQRIETYEERTNRNRNARLTQTKEYKKKYNEYMFRMMGGKSWNENGILAEKN